jgi:hypothetical protein
VRGNRHVVCLDWGSDERYLRLNRWGGDWLDSWYFLGVQEASDA